VAGKIALDSGALIALSRGNANARAILERWTRAGVETVLPCPVLAETLRGKPSDAAVHRIVNSRTAAITVLPVLEGGARDAGARLGQTSRKHVTVDAMIVAVAVEHGAREIVTCDPEDIAALSGADLSIIAI
jgi:predicted nucleic acid-binding protein